MKTFTNLAHWALNFFTPPYANNSLKGLFILFATLTLGVTNAWAAESLQATLDFTTNAWNLPTTKTVDEQSFTNGGYTIKVKGTTGNGYQFNSSTKCLLMGKSGATLTLPAFDFTTTKIVVTGKSGASGSVIQNIFVGSTEVSTATTGATGTNTYEINSSYQAAGNVYVLKVTSAHNTQITKIEVYGEASGTPPTPTTQYTIKWYTAVGTSTDVTLDEGATITKPETDPKMSGYEFMGWTDQCNVATDGAGFTALSDFGTADSDKDFYAVFAVAETTGGGAATDVTIDLSKKDQITTNTTSSLVFTEGDVTFTNTKLSGSTSANNYCPGTSGKTYTSTRTYNGHQVTIAAANTISKIVITAGTTGYATAIENATWTNATASVNNTTITVTPDANATSVSFKPSTTAGMTKVVVTTGGGSTSYNNYITTCSGSAPQPAVLVSIAKTDGKTEFTEGDTFEKATIIATYKDATTKDVTNNATFSAPNMNQIGEQTINVSYKEGDVTANTSYKINISEKPKYTITWNNAGTTTTTEVVQGEALGTLPEPADCPSGKKFMGWIAATSVNNDGSGITYIKPTDKPTANTTYYAVFAVVEGGGGTSTTATVSIANYATENGWTNSTQYKTISIDATITATAEGGANTGKYYTSGTNWRLYQNESPSLTISAVDGYEIQKVKVTYTNLNDGILTLDGSNVTSEVECTINAESVTFGVGNTGTATNGQVRVTAIEVVYAPAAAKSDYSLDCELHQDPYLTVHETAIDFGTVAQNETVTKTFTITGGYLAEDVALTISGTNASFFSVSPTTIAKADDVEETVTVTYNPTATGDHTATLTIKTGDITKEIALSGKVLTPGKWVLVKDVATLSAGDEIIIASAVADYAIGVAATNNYKGAAITKVGETANTTADVTILTVEATGDAEVPYAFKDGSKYLYAASNSANQLKAQSTNNANGQWAITITAEGVASIVAAKSTNRNVMQCNPNGGSPIFACYTSADYQQLAIYRNSENVVKPVISGDADFVGSTQVTITAQSGLTVYYTTDGTDPNNTSAQYTAPFTINATTTVKAIAYDASSNASGVAEMTFTKHELVNVATAMALAEDEVAYFDEFEVVKVVTGTQYIYIKDASGHGLIYDLNLATQLSDGDRVQGFVGISAPYGGLPEAKPVDGLTVADLTITSGVAAEPYDFTSTTIADTDINKYVVFNDVAITTNTDVSTNPTLTIGGNNVKFYNQFGISKTLEAGKTYDIYGFVAIYNCTLQVYFHQALEEGEVVTKYTVTYNAGGATGEVPVDDNEYTEGAQVYLKSATGLTKEGYDYKGWKVTDEGGNEIAVSSNKFNMPASNVTVTAQWEEIVVTPRQDFSAGLWVLVTDASELAADDYIIIAAAEENFAMKSYESGNNCKQVAITKFGNNNCFLTWTEEIGVFQLLANGSNYTIQDVNTKQYLYAAGSGTSNQLKANNNIATDENASKYVWTIAVDENGIATVKAISENRNWLRYNTNSGSDLFSCYGSGQQDIVLYKYVTDFYTRDVVTGNLGTICLPYASSKHAGATFYEIAYLEMNGTDPNRIYLDEVEGGVLEAGKPYIFQATSNKVTVAYEGEASSLKEGTKGLVGILEDTDVVEGTSGVSNSLTGNYVISGTKFYTCGTGCSIYKNRAYIDADIIAEHTTPVAEMPGRRRIAMGNASENQATGVDNTLAPKDNVVKVIENGQLIIIRDGVKYNVQGQKL